MGQGLHGGESRSQNVQERDRCKGHQMLNLRGRGGERDSPHQVRHITEMVSSKNGGFNCWKVLGAKIIKLIIDFECFLYAGRSMLCSLLHVLLYVILITTL